MSDIKPGVYPNTPYEVYASWAAARSTVLSKFDRSPSHARSAMLEPQEPTEEQDLGTATHTAILEPERFTREYAAAPQVDRRTREGKATWAAFVAEHPDATVLKAGAMNVCQRIRGSVWRQPWAEALLGSKGHSELSAAWEDDETGVLCKLRVDRLVAQFEGSPVILDIKTCQDASRESFTRSVARYGYHFQMAMYRDGLKHLSDHPRRCMWLAVEKTPPFGAALYEPSDEMLEAAHGLYRAALLQYVECERTGRWPGYSPHPQMIDLPAWARPSKFEEDDL